MITAATCFASAMAGAVSVNVVARYYKTYDDSAWRHGWSIYFGIIQPGIVIVIVWIKRLMLGISRP
jgi:hypothetical protein